MHEGKIIKFYRQKADLTQEQLGNGICSATHISKIERGLTEYSPEITYLLSSRLGINIESEIKNLKRIKKLLYDWHETLITEKNEDMESIKKELDEINLISVSDYKILYDLLTAKYHLINKNIKNAHSILKEIEIKQSKLPQFEFYLYKHVLGQYFLNAGEYSKAIDILRSIDFNHYNNPEYYHHLAIAYHYINSKVMAYHYAEKALQFYKQSNNFKRIIDVEMLMIIQISAENISHSYQEIIEKYHSLIKSCDVCSDLDKKAALYHNLAYEYFKNGEYPLAKKYYMESMLLKDSNTSIYLMSLHGYLNSCFDGDLLPKEEISDLIHQGLSTSRKIGDKLSTIVFKILKYQVQENNIDYYKYIEDEALSYFKTHGHLWLFKFYGKKLFNYYLKNGEKDRTLEIACYFVNS